MTIINRGTARISPYLPRAEWCCGDFGQFGDLEGAMAESGDKAGSQAVSVDMDAMIDEILARKGPQKYQDGLSEEKWEQVCSSPSLTPPPPHTHSLTYSLTYAQL